MHNLHRNFAAYVLKFSMFYINSALLSCLSYTHTHITHTYTITHKFEDTDTDYYTLEIQNL